MTSQIAPLQTLYDLEAQVIEAAEVIATAYDRFSWALYQIVEQRLYLLHLDDEGNQLYPNISDYLRHLDQQCLQSRSQMWASIRALRVAKAYEYDTFDKVSERGTQIFKKIADALPVDRGTHKIIGFTDKEVKQAIEELSVKPSASNAGYTPADIRNEINRRFRLGPEIWFEVHEDAEGKRLHWFRRSWNGSGEEKLEVGEVVVTMTDDPPYDVIEAVEKKLKRRY
jgi:hypothetical protein